MTQTGDQTAAGAADIAGAPAGEGVAGEAARRARRVPSGWYLLGLSAQVLLWMLVFLGIAVAIGVGHHLTEFRYVGF